jgi:outer membrane protein TolC
MYSANLGLVSVQLAKQMNQVALYKSLGGGIDQKEAR